MSCASNAGLLSSSFVNEVTGLRSVRSRSYSNQGAELYFNEGVDDTYAGTSWQSTDHRLCRRFSCFGGGRPVEVLDTVRIRHSVETVVEIVDIRLPVAIHPQF